MKNDIMRKSIQILVLTWIIPWKVKQLTWKSTHLHLSGRMKKGSTGQGGFPACSVGQLLGKAYPSNPGFSGISGMVFRHERHCTVILVAFTLIAEALMMIPGIFTSLDTCSLYNVEICTLNITQDRRMTPQLKHGVLFVQP